MTIRELRDIFTSDTKIFLVAYPDEDDLDITERFEIKNILYGNNSFADISICFNDVRAIGSNQIEVTTDMPIEIFRAWKKYSNDFYEKYGE